MYGQQIIPRSGDMYICHWYNKLKQIVEQNWSRPGGAKSTIAPGALDPRYATDHPFQSMNGYSFPQKVVRFGRFRGTPTKCDPQKKKINENARNKRNVGKKEGC